MRSIGLVSRLVPWPIARAPHFVALVLLFIPTLAFVTPILRGDGVGYYAYVASAIVDNDLDFADDYAHADSWHHRLYFDDQGRVREALRTPTGHLANQFSTGPAVLWSPFFLIAQGLSTLQNKGPLESASDPRDGFSKLYLYTCAVGTALLGFVGLLLSYDVARRIVSPWAALWATLGIWFASALPVYMYFLPFMSHAHSAFVASLFVWYWWRTSSVASVSLRTRSQWLLLGLLAGFLFTTYYVNSLFWIFVLADFIAVGRRAWAIQESPRATGLLLSRAVMPFGAGLVLGLLPHALAKMIVYGSPFALGYGEAWYLASPRLFEVLLSSEHGLWSWTPVLALATVGLAFLTRCEPGLGWRAVATTVAFWFVIASFQNWHGQSSFSNRFFVSLTPVFVLGLASFLETVEAKWSAASLTLPRVPILPMPRVVFALTLCFLAAWNFGFIFQWGTNLIPNRGPISWSTMVRNQFAVVPGRMASLAGRFFGDRDRLVEEVERQDMDEAKQYRIRR